MIIWNNLRSEDRILRWREFRKEIESIEDQEDVLKKVAEFWASVPIGSRTVDFYTPESWPDPWEILHYGTFCSSSISLLIYYTLELLPNFKGKLQIVLIDDGEDRFIVPMIDDQYILNYELGEISTWLDLTDRYGKKLRVIDDFRNNEIKRIN